MAHSLERYGTFITAVIIIGLLLDEAGFSKWAALHVARWGGGSTGLFAFIVLLGAAIVCLFMAQATLVHLLESIFVGVAFFSTAATLAFVMAAGLSRMRRAYRWWFPTWSTYRFCRLLRYRLQRYASIMVPVNIVSVAATLTMLLWFFRKDLPKPMTSTNWTIRTKQSRPGHFYVAGWWVLALL